VIDLQNTVAGNIGVGLRRIRSQKEYEVSAKGGPGGVQLAVRLPSKSTTFRSEVGQAIDYYFFYGPALNQVNADYRQLSGEAPLFPKWAYGYCSAGALSQPSRKYLDIAAEFGSEKFPSTRWSRTGSMGGKYGWSAMKFDRTVLSAPKEMMDRLHSRTCTC